MCIKFMKLTVEELHTRQTSQGPILTIFSYALKTPFVDAREYLSLKTDLLDRLTVEVLISSTTKLTIGNQKCCLSQYM